MTKAKKKAIAARLAQLEDRVGRLTPDIVVADARKPSSPLHSQFDWDDRKAGHSWRLEQARELIRTVRYVVTTEHRVIELPKYLHDPSLASGKQGYVSTVRLMSDKDRARDALVNELSTAASFVRRAHDLAQAFGLAGEIQKIESQIGRVKKKVEARAH